MLEDALLDAARDIAAAGGDVTLPALLHHPGVRGLVRSQSRVIDAMTGLEGRRLLRLACTHPARRWEVVPR